jgi:hypothetical protein
MIFSLEKHHLIMASMIKIRDRTDYMAQKQEVILMQWTNSWMIKYRLLEKNMNSRDRKCWKAIAKGVIPPQTWHLLKILLKSLLRPKLISTKL